MRLNEYGFFPSRALGVRHPCAGGPPAGVADFRSDRRLAFRCTRSVSAHGRGDVGICHDAVAAATRHRMGYPRQKATLSTG